MRWSELGLRNAGSMVAAVVFSFLLAAPAAEEKQLTVFAERTTYSVPLLDRGGEYVGLVEVLEPLCGVSAFLDKNKWRLRCDRVDSEFKVGASEAKVAGKKIALAGTLVVERDRGYVPLRSLPSLLILFLAKPIDLHESGRRLFVGDTAVRFTPELRKDALVLNFSAPVNPVISTEPGKLKMTFARDPIAATSTAMRFDNPLVSSMSYAEANGRAEITVSSTAPLLASFGDQGKTITLSAAPSQAPAAAAPPAGPAPAATAQAPPPPAAPPPRPQYVVILDPAHGGDERGAALTDKLAEKDVNLAFARRIRFELQVRGIPTLMSRDSDYKLWPDQRATLANTSRTILYVSVHTGTLGHGVRIYTSMLPTEDLRHGLFRPWDSAQADFLQSSQTTAEQIASEIRKHEIAVNVEPATLRPLNNIQAPAIAIELEPPPSGVEGLTAGSYQTTVASSMATAVSEARQHLEQGR
ncbi:MAG: N-acetylmuramoyl-L-alanine amidase [Acidobacteriaceae bacterium]|nr:N-acetylmuramoyl-L-alanine amidase [Acidobacteriaceae bacterium]